MLQIKKGRNGIYRNLLSSKKTAPWVAEEIDPDTMDRTRDSFQDFPAWRLPHKERAKEYNPKKTGATTEESHPGKKKGLPSWGCALKKKRDKNIALFFIMFPKKHPDVILKNKRQIVKKKALP